MSHVTEDEFNSIVRAEFKSLPCELTEDNLNEFVKACNRVESLCADQSLYRLLIPFHYLTFGWQSAYGKGFTWNEFFNDIIANGCSVVNYSENNFGAMLWFKPNKEEVAGFCISVEHDD